MKSFLKYFLIALIATTLIPVSCKKGPNDPFSLSGRTSRLTGTWKLTNESYTVTQVQGNTTTTRVYTLDGGKIKLVTTTKIGNSAAVTNTTTWDYTESWTFAKDNTYTATIMEFGASELFEGNWAWIGADDKAELKKKEALLLNNTKTVIGSQTTTTNSTDDPSVIVLDELGKSKMVITMDESQVQGSDSKTTKGSKTYAQ